MSLFNGSKPETRAKRGGLKGQAILEFALVLPILLLIIFGLIEAARLIFIYGAVVTSSREAARYGSVMGLVDGNPNAFRYQDCAGITQTAQDVAFLIDPSTLVVTIEYDDGVTPLSHSGCFPDADGIDADVVVTQGDRITVTVSTDYAPLVPVLPQFTINNIETASSRTFLGMIEYWPE